MMTWRRTPTNGSICWKSWRERHESSQDGHVPVNPAPPKNKEDTAHNEDAHENARSPPLYAGRTTWPYEKNVIHMSFKYPKL